MLLQKTGWRIKHFLAQKRDPFFVSSGDTIGDDGYLDIKLAAITPRRLSWLSQTSSAETPPFPRPSSSARERSPHQSEFNSTAHSSASSLCSCDCEAHPVPIEHSLFHVEIPQPLPEVLYLPPLPLECASDDAKSWQLIFEEPTASLLHASQSTSSPGSVSAIGIASASGFDIDSTLAANTIDDDKTPTQSLKDTESATMDELSDNVEQLIRETDEAFKAIGTALADAKAATQGWHDQPTAPVKPPALARGVSRREPRPSNVTSRIPVHRVVSVSKGKKKRQIKKTTNLFGRVVHKVPPPPANTPARWTLTDVTTNMFSGKMFRTEVDEMLTPGRIQQQLKNNQDEKDRKVSMESTTSFGTDGSTPTEPFHLESLGSRIAAVNLAAVQRDLPLASNPDPPLLSTQMKPATPHTAFPTPHTMVDTIALPSGRSEMERMVFDNFSFPDPPPPIPPRAARRPSAPRATQMLPTIPEVSSLNIIPTKHLSTSTSSNSTHPSLSILSPPTVIFLPSTHYTLTSPLFLHGPIRLERLLRNGKGSSPEEEALDWIAFQMAISGTIQDEKTSDLRNNAELEADEAEIDNLIAWWASFGFEGYGRMECAADVKKTAEPAMSKAEEQKQSELYEQKRNWRNWTTPTPQPTTNAPLEPLLSSHKLNWTDDILASNDRTSLQEPYPHPSPYSLTESLPAADARSSIMPPMLPRRPSLAESLLSLPRSPMLDLVVEGDSVGRDEEAEVIPMGFNLRHDLEDFLSWEARHVAGLYAGEGV